MRLDAPTWMMRFGAPVLPMRLDASVLPMRPEAAAFAAAGAVGLLRQPVGHDVLQRVHPVRFGNESEPGPDPSADASASADAGADPLHPAVPHVSAVSKGQSADPADPAGVAHVDTRMPDHLVNLDVDVDGYGRAPLSYAGQWQVPTNGDEFDTLIELGLVRAYYDTRRAAVIMDDRRLPLAESQTIVAGFNEEQDPFEIRFLGPQDQQDALFKAACDAEDSVFALNETLESLQMRGRIIIRHSGVPNEAGAHVLVVVPMPEGSLGEEVWMDRAPNAEGRIYYRRVIFPTEAQLRERFTLPPRASRGFGPAVHDIIEGALASGALEPVLDEATGDVNMRWRDEA
ncbi:MAG: hypothetical protein KC475_06030 [Cyanobacteria bacterium HKST-UBA03]|nr:hypothetical protein [Cyanobacteria bacterium HKST-UBA03]